MFDPSVKTKTLEFSRSEMRGVVRHDDSRTTKGATIWRNAPKALLEVASLTGINQVNLEKASTTVRMNALPLPISVTSPQNPKTNFHGRLGHVRRQQSII